MATRCERCRLCGSPQARAFERGGWHYLRCASCGAITKALSAEQYASLDPQYDPGPPAVLEEGVLLREYLGVAHQRRLLETLHVSAPTPRFLDIGCGAGGSLLAARELGWNAEGVEPSHSHSTIARQLGFQVHEGFFEPAAFSGRSFDVVLMSHVVEHLLEPKSFLEGVVSVLAPSGVLVLVTPNAGSVVSRLSGRWWPMLKTVDHVSLLAPRSVKELGLERFGTVRVGQAEEPWEATASLASAARDALRERVLGRGSTPEGAAAPGGARSGAVRWDDRYEALRKVFALTSFPVFALGALTGRRACLVITLTKE
ncbi:MAG: methyltransferase domain-containing protein [Myxococcales bacterium]|nr:methyltransferase domain-containing protein [Myxococcales bacterium]